MRGGFVIAGFGALLTGHLLSGLSGSGTPRALAWLGAPPLAAAHLAGLAVGALMLCVPMIRRRREAMGSQANPAGPEPTTATF